MKNNVAAIAEPFSVGDVRPIEAAITWPRIQHARRGKYKRGNVVGRYLVTEVSRVYHCIKSFIVMYIRSFSPLAPLTSKNSSADLL
jgi:hypothetical protein